MSRSTWGRDRLLVDGQVVPANGRIHSVIDDNGIAREAVFQRRMLGFDIPLVKIGDTVYETAPGLPVAAAVLAAFPLILVGIGGLLGGLLGAIAAVLNFSALRLERPWPVRLLVVAVIYLVTFVVFVVIALLVSG